MPARTQRLAVDLGQQRLGDRRNDQQHHLARLDLEAVVHERLCPAFDARIHQRESFLLVTGATPA